MALLQQSTRKQMLHMGRSEVDSIDTSPPDIADKGFRIPANSIRDEMELMPSNHPQQRVPRSVKRQRRNQCHPCRRTHHPGKVATVVLEETDEAAVCDQDALWLPRGARRVNRVGRVIGE